MLGLKHYQKRKKRAPEGGFPTRDSVKRTAADLLVYPAAVIAPLALLPQAWTLYATRDAGGLAFLTWFVLALINVVWIFYGHAHRERPIVLTNCASLILNSAIALGILLYR